MPSETKYNAHLTESAIDDLLALVGVKRGAAATSITRIDIQRRLDLLQEYINRAVQDPNADADALCQAVCDFERLVILLEVTP
jgi:hypothetical protein